MQVSEWIAYDSIDPIGELRKDYMMAYLMTVITNIAIGALAKRGTPLKDLKDFIPNWEREDGEEEIKQQSLEDMKKTLFAIAGKHGVKKRKPGEDSVRRPPRVGRKFGPYKS